MDQDADLHKLTSESIKIIITINSLEKADSRLREKILEAAADQELTDTLFKRLLSEHESWFQNRTNTGGVRRAEEKIEGHLESKKRVESQKEERDIILQLER